MSYFYLKIVLPLTQNVMPLSSPNEPFARIQMSVFRLNSGCFIECVVYVASSYAGESFGKNIPIYSLMFMQTYIHVIMWITSVVL